MAGLNVGDMYDYVRAYLDTDDVELPDSLLVVWRNEGTARVQRTFEPWSFFEADWSLTTSAASVAFGDISTADAQVDQVTSVEAPNWTLSYLPHDTAVAAYAWSDTAGGIPLHFSVRADTLFLWPIPGESQSYTVRGYRQPNDAVDAASSIDLPDEFDPLVCEWMLARAYERQDDEIMSAQKFGRFEQQLDGFRRRYTRGPGAGVQVLGGNRSDTMMMPDRQPYSWET